VIQRKVVRNNAPIILGIGFGPGIARQANQPRFIDTFADYLHRAACRLRVNRASQTQQPASENQTASFS
jgi:hypothetical protein